jgi:nitrite reductase/ring-hydroxylating ferredoxin subunit
LTNLLGGVFTLLLAIPGLFYLVDPRNRPARSNSFRPVGKLSGLPLSADGKPAAPVQAVIRDNRRDAWTVHLDEHIGRVWLVRIGDQVRAFTAICPHLGCSINYEKSQQRFICPCHNGTFHASTNDRLGQRLTVSGSTNPAPRSMDELEVRLVEIPESDGDFEIEVKYEDFISGLHEAVPST